MAARIKTEWICTECGSVQPKWSGRCPSCSAWNTLEEELKSATVDSAARGSATTSQPILLSEVPQTEFQRVVCQDKELNRVLGGGIVPGAVMLMGGEPGIGKSTLLLQLALEEIGPAPILYACGEESAAQVRQRALRLGGNLNRCYLLAETSVPIILEAADRLKARMIIIDSIQTMSDPHIDAVAGSVAQIRYAAAQFTDFAKERNVPLWLIGHITKEGQLAGPKLVEHLVDTVLQFEGDRHLNLRLVRCLKNRFGSTLELGIYEMASAGLQPVADPALWFSGRTMPGLSGMATGSSREGNRALLVEVQALVTPSVFGVPQRGGTGMDSRRLAMLLAVLEKRCGLRMGPSDVFLNITGGLKTEDPAMDLAVCVALAGSAKDRVIDAPMLFAAEIGLGGELRPVTAIEARLGEASRLGYNLACVADQQPIAQIPKGMRILKHTLLRGLLEEVLA